MINDHLRMNHFYKDSKKYFLSIFVSMVLSSILIYYIRGYSDIFMYMIVYELILFTEGKLSKLFITLEILFVYFIMVLRSITIEDFLSLGFWKDHFVDILMSSVGLLFYTFMLYAYREIRKEKRKVEELNKELKLSYNKLQEQSEKIEQLSISKERNRLAGEIHDNLGHNLIALNMNLDVADKLIDSDIDKAKELINRSRLINKESIEDLRKAVYALKEEEPMTLRSSINKLIDNIQSTGEVEVILSLDENVEKLLPEYKDLIYLSIKECITNSIKHGKANRINIDIIFDNSKLDVNVQDNGLGCNQLIKGNGLLRIEERVTKNSGEVKYSLNDEGGFKIYLTIDNLRGM
ncbi:MAG: sensor histidine kinase [Tissierellaceae bacterium]|nr:sensor histidine kinase [Tissierellaceae bacterium]